MQKGEFAVDASGLSVNGWETVMSEKVLFIPVDVSYSVLCYACQ